MASREEPGPSERLGLSFPIRRVSGRAKSSVISLQPHLFLRFPPQGPLSVRALLEAQLYHRLPRVHPSGHANARRIQSKGLCTAPEASPWPSDFRFSLTFSLSQSLPIHEITAPELSPLPYPSHLELFKDYALPLSTCRHLELTTTQAAGYTCERFFLIALFKSGKTYTWSGSFEVERSTSNLGHACSLQPL